MSKKMMKRSLALGALMAFVITGQAWAVEKPAANTNDYGLRLNPGGVNWTFTDTVNNEGVSTENHYSFNSPIIVNMNGHDWNINSGDKIGIEAWSGGNKITNGGILNINSKQGIFFRSGTNEIQVEKLIITGALGTYGKTTINANEVEINLVSGSNAVQAYDDISFGSADKVLKSFKINGEDYDRAIRVAAGAGVSVFTDYINISGAQEEIKATGSGSLSIEAKNGIIESSVVAGDNGSKGVVNLTLGSGVTMTGSVVTDTVGTGDGASSSTLNLNGATWNVTGASEVTTLNGEGGNIVVNDITKEQVAVGTDNTKKLTVSATADAKGITGNAEEDLKALSNTVKSQDQAAADTAKITGGSVYDEVSAEIKQDGTLGNVNKEVAAANVSVNDMAAIGLMSWRAEMNDMNKRMGELRNANGEHGVWVRMVRGESEYNSVKNQYNQYQLGYDEKLSVDKRWTVGVALSYTDAENNFAQGTGESTNKALSIYGSKLNDDGTFIDLIAKYARLENDFTTYSGQGAGEYDANGYSFSAEFGKRIQQGKGLWIEPQVELTYGKVGSAEYVTEKGVNVAQDSMESLVGRVGFSLGKDIEKGNVYARASYLYDFDGETKATLNNDAVLENDLGGGWWEVGVGANINLSKATYIYADIEKTFGGEVDTNWQWNLGVRYSF